jgi:type IV pilus assembly protein PilE
MQQQERHYSRYNTYIDFSRASPNGFKWHSADTPQRSAYEISAAGCKDESLQDCVMLSAQPGTAHVDAHYRDEACGTLTLASSGAQGATGSAAGCW